MIDLLSRMLLPVLLGVGAFAFKACLWDPLVDLLSGSPEERLEDRFGRWNRRLFGARPAKAPLPPTLWGWPHK
ncbi:MAG: hypothetical protein HYY18_21780 [Planctomycetes bacterium]|nr:hypothetical protein [Planctomycetota bacterium]